MRSSLVMFFAPLVVSCSSAPEDGSLAVTEEWPLLVGSEWSVEPGVESYLCVRKTLTEDVYVAAFDAVAPPGTHHTVLTWGEPDAPDDVVACDSFTNHDIMAYGSGVGALPFEMPDGVTTRIPAGKQLLLNLHVFNATPATLAGASGVRFRPAEQRDGLVEAEAVLMGPMELTLPPGEHTVTGGCTLQDDATLFAIGPHMHQLGRHMQVVAHSSVAGDVLVHDEPYSFEDQQIFPLAEPVQLRAGDRVEVRCDYENDTGATVGWGESSLDEMCFAGAYRYPPAENGFFVCAE
jgi:hypothetical protein